MSSSVNIERYTRVAIILHWLIALAILAQLAGGLWMVDAIKEKESQALAYDVYQWHKAVGLIILTLSLLRLVWRFTHTPPPMPAAMAAWQKCAAHGVHGLLYLLMIAIPILGWAMVSTSPYGLPTMIFGLFEWPHIPWLLDIANKTEWSEWFEEAHELAAYSMMLLLCVHIGAALQHQLIHKDHLLRRMLP